jgi:Xaa-Pro aminopeptidase
MGVVKTPEELIHIITASAMNDACFQHMVGYLRPGLTEVQVAEEIFRVLSKLGSKKLAFPTIAVAGENGAEPHGIPTEYIIREGDFLTMDFGATVKGYCGDMTRTVALGHATPTMKKIYQVVLAAQLAGLDACKRGATYREVDEASRGIIEDAGYGPYYVHGTGHGVGKEVHEEPYLNKKATHQKKLKTHMAVTVEPGIYIPGKMGVRIEDLVVITDFGVVNTNHSPKELLIIK